MNFDIGDLAYNNNEIKEKILKSIYIINTTLLIILYFNLLHYNFLVTISTILVPELSLGILKYTLIYCLFIYVNTMLYFRH